MDYEGKNRVSEDKKANTDFTRKLALEKGFDLVGIAEACQLDDESVRLQEWLSRGYQASMTWMGRNLDKRTDPANLLQGACSVISLAKNYHTPFSHGKSSAKISRYAWGDDYHIIIDRMLKKFVKALRQKFPDKSFVYYCDTGPVMDKAWAQRAGVGWIGKHTNVINKEIGSWIFLSEVITDLECEYDAVAVDHCGSCRACIDACPTGSIVEPYVLDSNRCISFLTIENRDDSIPASFIPNLDNWLFGCDICQDVCPWNVKFQTATDQPGFQPREGILNLNPDEIHLMTREEFAERFRHSPVKRAKYEGLRRNANALSLAAQARK